MMVTICGENFPGPDVTTDFELVLITFEEFYWTGDVSRTLLN